MKTTKPSHRIIAVFLTLNFLTTLFPVNILYASNNGPTAPEAASFEPVDATDMVNLATGDLSYVLPLLNVPSPEGGYPLALSYHAGIALDQEASWVGLGWNINPGAINRSVVGVPDDWKNGLKSKVSYDDGGTVTIDNLYLGLGVTDNTSVGLNATWVTNKTSGGERTVNFTKRLAGRGTFESPNGTQTNIDASIGSDGLSVGISVDKNSRAKSSLGIGFESVNSTFSYKPQISNSDRTATIGAYSSMPIGTSISLNLDLGLLDASYNRSKIKYWNFDEKDYYATGSLYSGSFDVNANNDPLFYFNEYDASESLSSSIDYSSTFSQNNPAYVTYDNYNVNAQGLNGNISPKLLELGRLHTAATDISDKSLFKNVNGNERKVNRISGSNFNPNSPEIRSTLFSKTLDDFVNRPYFYMNNEFSSYHKTLRNSRSNFLNLQNETDYASLYRGIQYFPNTESQNYDNASNRLRRGNYIETFTNKELTLNNYLIYDVLNLDRLSMPEDGIGAFKVTVMDGKTYHYSLPVYQKESSQVIAQSDEDINLRHLESQSLEPYATHWLLTAITGPDFVDNGDSIINEGDIGYWVRFDYGKWTDGYTWRMPKTGYNYTDSAKSYSWGVKDVYYLNSISTRTHTALFIKNERLDNLSSRIDIHDANDNAIFRNALYRATQQAELFNRGADQNWYFAGAYRKLNFGSNPGLILYNNVLVENENWFYAKSKQIKSYALNEIMLLKNVDVPEELKSLSLSSGNFDINQEKNFEIKFEEQTFYQVGGNNYSTEKEAYVDKIYRGEYKNNILESEDFDFNLLREKALKTINFGYSDLMDKMGLTHLSFKGKKGKQVIPPYQFEYYNESEFSRNDFDNWGYHKNFPWDLSLKTIINPLGGGITVKYESDTFFEKSVETSYLDSNLQVKFEGTNSGVKYVSVRQDPNINLNQKLDFLKYFIPNEYYNLDIQYFQDPNHNGDNWIADVATACEVIAVSEDIIKFQLPANSNKTWVRLKSNCETQNWIYYQNGEFNHIVDETVDWEGEERESSCDIPGDGNRKIKARVFFNESNKEQLGGGIRTQKITLEDSQGRTFETSYNYNLLDNSTNIKTNVTSGSTSYAPERFYRKSIPYIDLVPSPSVMYKNVRVNNFNNTYTDYSFETLNNYTMDLGRYENNLLKIDISQGENTLAKLSGENTYFPIDEKFYVIEDKLSLIGSLVSVNNYNSSDQLINSTETTYLSTDELNEKYNTELFVKEEHIIVADTYDTPVNLSTTTISQIPSILKSVKTIENNNSFIRRNNLFDPIAGQVLEYITTNSNGQEIKATKVPAYTKYPQMGSKVDNPSNKNMLSQEAMNISEKFDGGQWKKMGAAISTWQDWGSNIWRKQKSFTWDGATDNDGYFTNFSNDVNNDDGFDWVNNVPGTSNSEWKQLSEITRYNDFSMPLEIKDLNQNYASTKMDFENEKTIASGNAGYGELFYSGAEDEDGAGNYGGEVGKGSATDSNDAHTGSKALNIGSGQNGFRVTIATANATSKKFKISLWVKNGQEQHVKFYNGSQNVEPKTDETIRAGSWKLLSFYSEINNGAEVYVTATGGSAIVDDFRIHPISSSMTSFVYNEWGELSHILGGNNLATRYEYDANGRLLRTSSEVVDFNGLGSGGFKKVTENRYTYKISSN